MGLLDQQVIVVNHRAIFRGLKAKLSLFDANGGVIGAIQQSGLGIKTGRTFQILDTDGDVLLSLFWAGVVKPRAVVSDVEGNEIGEVAVRKRIGKPIYGLVVGGTDIGTLAAENLRQWDFAITDASGQEVGRVRKPWEGFWKAQVADTYVVQIHEPLQDPMRVMVVASSVVPAIVQAIERRDSSIHSGRGKSILD